MDAASAAEQLKLLTDPSSYQSAENITLAFDVFVGIIRKNVPFKGKVGSRLFIFVHISCVTCEFLQILHNCTSGLIFGLFFSYWMICWLVLTTLWMSTTEHCMPRNGKINHLQGMPKKRFTNTWFGFLKNITADILLFS